MSNSLIYPLAYEPLPGRTQIVYDLAFPRWWKEELIRIARANYSGFRAEHNLPTWMLDRLVNSWMEDIVSLKSLNASSNDRRWLSSCQPFTRERLDVLCQIIRLWITGTYMTAKKPPLVKEMAKRLRDTIESSEFAGLTSERTVTLSLPDGTVNSDAFNALPLLAVNRLQKKELELNNRILHLCYAARNELVTLPLEEPKTHHLFSYVLHFSVQTVPLGRMALLLCDISVRRWIPGLKHPEKPVVSPCNINAHIYIRQSDKYCQIPIEFSDAAGRVKEPTWKYQDRECYNLYGYEPLPDIPELWKQIGPDNRKYLLPYKTGMWSFYKSAIGTGVSMAEKEQFYHAVSGLLDGLAKESVTAVSGKQTTYKIECRKSPDEYGDTEQFRAWAAQCAESGHITFELYGLQNDPGQEMVLDEVQKTINEHFGENHPDSCLRVDILRCESGDMCLALNDQTHQEKIRRSDQIRRELKPASDVTACIFVLPDAETFQNRDPKDSIRHGFALTGRVVQFIRPKETDESKETETSETFENRVKSALYDLYRQIGITTFVNTEKIDEKMAAKILAGTPCVGMHILTQLHGIQNKGRFLPVFVRTDLLSGRTRVFCSAFDHSPVSYREACLEMARLFEKSDLEKRCTQASFSPAKHCLMTLRNTFSAPENPVVLLVRTNGTTRYLWKGISDKAVSEYARMETFPYVPEKIDIGTQDNSYCYPLKNTGVRIIRVRDNDEIPDYYTEAKEPGKKYKSTSGVFQYHDTFWSVADRPFDKKYTASLGKNRFDGYAQNFAEKHLIELYPLQLQPGDDPWRYIRFAHTLRSVPVQFRQEVNLPLPLHLARQLEEYLFNI